MNGNKKLQIINDPKYETGVGTGYLIYSYFLYFVLGGLLYRTLRSFFLESICFLRKNYVFLPDFLVLSLYSSYQYLLLSRKVSFICRRCSKRPLASSLVQCTIGVFIPLSSKSSYACVMSFTHVITISI